MMGRALFLSLPLHGHVNPSLALVHELVERGETITYYSTDEFASSIRRTGAAFAPYRSTRVADLHLLPERLEELSRLLIDATAEVLDHQLDEFRAARPDYLIADSVAPWGQWLAEILRAPLATSTSTFAVNRRVLAYAARHGARPQSARAALAKFHHVLQAFASIRRLRRRYRVTGPGVMGSLFGRSRVNIVYTSRLFQPCAATFDASFHFIGPSIQSRTLPADFSWTPLQDRAIVYVSLGTLFNQNPLFFKQCVEAFSGADFRVIMAVGHRIPTASLGPLPPNITVHAYVPQLEVLQRTGVFVTHGGMNSVNEGLFYGLPLLVIPQMNEQLIVGRRVEELGAGLCLTSRDLAPDTLRVSVTRLLADVHFRQQAAVVCDSLRGAGGVTRGADAILRFVQSR
jgi:MGT family glycosyltransferase